MLKLNHLPSFLRAFVSLPNYLAFRRCYSYVEFIDSFLIVLFSMMQYLNVGFQIRVISSFISERALKDRFFCLYPLFFFLSICLVYTSSTSLQHAIRRAFFGEEKQAIFEFLKKFTETSKFLNEECTHSQIVTFSEVLAYA